MCYLFVHIQNYCVNLQPCQGGNISSKLYLRKGSSGNIYKTIMKILFIHPPIVKPSEPPAGIGRLSACLQTHGVEHDVIDANLEGLHFLLSQSAQKEQTDRWSKRACKNLEANLAALRNIHTFSNFSRYSRAVSDISHVLQLSGQPFGANLSLADYTHTRLSPAKTADLMYAAEHPEENPYYPYFRPRLSEALDRSPDFVGFSLNYLSQALCTLAMIGFIKKMSPRQKILLGGSLATSWVKITGRHDLFTGLVDEIVSGAGEERLLELARVKSRDEGAFTDYSLLRTNRYLSPGFVLPYSASRGCWWRRCAFCPEKAEENPYRPIPAGQVTEELQELVLRTQPSLLHLLDSSISPAVLSALVNRPPGTPWYGFARVTKHLADKSFCRALKASGCVMLKLGIESGDQRVLDALDKGIDLNCVSAVLRHLKAAGIAVYGYFLFGTPPEDEAAALQTLDFISKNAECLTYLNLAIFNLPALSLEAQSLDTRDFYEGDLSLYKDFRHPKGWQRHNIRIFLDKKLKKHAAIAPAIRRTPEFFTSNHAPFFHF